MTWMKLFDDELMHTLMKSTEELLTKVQPKLSHKGGGDVYVCNSKF